MVRFLLWGMIQQEGTWSKHNWNVQIICVSKILRCTLTWKESPSGSKLWEGWWFQGIFSQEYFQASARMSTKRLQQWPQWASSRWWKSALGDAEMWRMIPGTHKSLLEKNICYSLSLHIKTDEHIYQLHRRLWCHRWRPFSQSGQAWEDWPWRPFGQGKCSERYPSLFF